tara:strand:- start:1245 stop:1607 length:363 start_codon:yes stop_codon:yes gene_type:complete
MSETIRKSFFFVFFPFFSFFLACQEVPEPPPDIPIPSSEQEIHEEIRRLGGVVGERNPNGNIVVLTLEGASVTDKVIEKLTALKRLEILILHDTRVTRKGVKKMNEEMPKLKIIAKRSGK